MSNRSTLIRSISPDETSITPSNIDHYIMATFDNIYVNGVLYENFNIANINQLDPSKWKWPSQAAIVDDKLQFDLHDFVGRGHGGIAFTHIQPITSVQADTTVTIALLTAVPEPRLLVHSSMTVATCRLLDDNYQRRQQRILLRGEAMV